jgi:hypothetical protein
MNVATWAVVLATLLGPVLAVQAQRIVQRRTEARERKLWLFRALMNTRAGTLTLEHVNAINAVPLEFHKDAVIMQAWRTYLDHLNNQSAKFEMWGPRRVELYTDLLEKMAKSLKYGFDPLQLKNEIYAPRGHIELETDQQTIRRGVVELIEGKRTLPLEVRSIAQDEEMAKAMRSLYASLDDWLKGKITPRVKIDDSPSPPQNRPRSALEDR